MERFFGYHGTSGPIVGHLCASERGTFGAGVYLGDLACAVEYACADEGCVLEYAVALSSLYHYEAEFDHEYDLDSPAVGLIKAIFPPEEAERLIRQSMDDDALFGDEVRSQLQAQGHDGVMVNYGDGAFELVVFDSQALELVQAIRETDARLLLDHLSSRKATRPAPCFG